MEITGIIKKIGKVQDITDTFKKRDVILTTEDQYPQTICVECTQERTEIINGFKEGDKVKFNINIRGREWVNPEGETKYFNSIQGWRVEKLDSISSPSEMGGSSFNQSNQNNNSSDNSFDDLPF